MAVLKDADAGVGMIEPKGFRGREAKVEASQNPADHVVGNRNYGSTRILAGEPLAKAAGHQRVALASWNDDVPGRLGPASGRRGSIPFRHAGGDRSPFLSRP